MKNNENSELENSKTQILENQNTNLKSQINQISNKIESTLNNIHNRKNQIMPSAIRGKTDFINSFQSVQQVINNYKDSIDVLKVQINSYSNIEGLEQEINKRKEKLFSLKNENKVLTNIYNNQQKALEEYNTKGEKHEQKIMNDRCRALKDEYKYSKEILKTIEFKVKNQNQLIFNLIEKNDKIREKIESSSNNKFESNDNNNYNNVSESDIKSLEYKVKCLEEEIALQEKNYKNEVNKQNFSLNSLNKTVKTLSMTLKEKEQEIRIKELKYKEIQRFNKNSNKNNNQIYKERQERSISANHYKKPQINNNFNNKAAIERNRNTIMVYQNRGNNKNKPFESNQIKFKDVKIKVENNEIRDPETVKQEMLNKIENLKSEIQDIIDNTNVDSQWKADTSISDQNKSKYATDDRRYLIFKSRKPFKALNFHQNNN